MKHFFYVIIIFVSILFVYFIITGFVNKYIILETNPQIKKANVLIIGDSHTQRAINPDYFSSASNISQLAEPYVVSYWKLKKIFNFYHPDSVILGFGPHNLSELDDFRFSTERWSTEMFYRAYPIGNFENLRTIPIDYKLLYTTLFKNLCLFPKLHHNNYIGEYFPETLNKLTNNKETIKKHFFISDKKLYGISNTAVSYLDSIMILCENKNVELILINCPVHYTYKQNIPSFFSAYFEKQKKHYTDKEIRIIDFSDLQLADSCYSDADHLNFRGANIFTKHLIEQLR